MSLEYFKKTFVFIKHLLSAYYIQRTVLCTERNETYNFPQRTPSLVGITRNEVNKNKLKLQEISSY